MSVVGTKFNGVDKMRKLLIKKIICMFNFKGITKKAGSVLHKNNTIIKYKIKEQLWTM
jgi:hypothetical protein